MPDFILVILAVIFVLGIAINIHEFGHFLVAKLFGMRVEAYSFFGLGPRVWGFKVGHTDYRVSAIPLGAYVKLYGDEATAPLEGGDSSDEKVPDAELYELRPRWQKFLVMLGGPFMNVMLALAIPFAGALMYGIPTMPSPVIANVKDGGAAEKAGIKVGDRIVGFDGKENPTWQRIDNDSKISPERPIPLVVERSGSKVDLMITPTRIEDRGNVIGSLDLDPTELVILSPQADSPAAAAGIQKGDKALSINGVTVTGLKSFRDTIQESKGQPVRLTVIRNNQPTDLTVQAKDDGKGQYLIGAGLSNQSQDKEKASVAQCAAFAAEFNLEIVRLTGRVFGQLFTGQRSVKDAGLSGPVGIVSLIAQIVREAGFAGLVSVLAVISLNLGVFNLLPIPLLDGGQIMVLAIEKVMSWFGRTLSMAWKERIQLTGLAVILLLIVFVTFLDISRFF
ncbi:MAG: RIP metalloprotease RseP [Acidobacteriota bacterium]